MTRRIAELEDQVNKQQKINRDDYKDVHHRVLALEAVENTEQRQEQDKQMQHLRAQLSNVINRMDQMENKDKELGRWVTGIEKMNISKQMKDIEKHFDNQNRLHFENFAKLEAETRET